MIFTKTFKYRLRPNRKVIELFAQFAGACRWVFNWGLAMRSTLWQKEKRSVTVFDQNNALTLLKQEKSSCWLQDIHSQILQQALGDLRHAFNHFFRRVKDHERPGYPHFRCRGKYDSFRYPQGVKIEGDRVWLPKIGWVRFRKSREIEGTIKQTTVIKEGRYWYVCFTCEIEQADREVDIHDIIGIDLGIEHFATVATDQGIEEITNPCFFKNKLPKIRYLSRQLSKKTSKSNTRLKAKQTLSTLHARLRNQRKDWLHKLSTQLVKSHDKLVVESLHVKELLVSAPKSLARAINDAGWREFLQMLKYKCEETGKEFQEAKQYFPSTKQCFRCRKRNEISLNTREYLCSCGFKIHRDHNAALNLKAVGTSV